MSLEQVAAVIGMITGCTGLGLSIKANRLAREANNIELSKLTPNLFIERVAVERTSIRSISYDKILDMNNLLDIDPDTETDFLVLTIGNTGGSTITSIKCKAVSVHAGDLEEYQHTGDGIGYEASQEISVSINLPTGGLQSIHILAGNADALFTDYLTLPNSTSRLENATLYFKFEVQTVNGYTYPQYLSYSIKNTTENGYGTWASWNPDKA